MASEKGNKGNKRKCEKIVEESANKHLPDTSPTFSEIRQDKRGQEETNWMKYCKTVDKIPQCTICAEKYCYFIDSKLFEEHLKSTHIRNIHLRIHSIRREEPNWIFNFFERVPKEHYLKCRMCDVYTGEVQFKGPFVRHFYEDHDKIAKQNDELIVNQGSHRDAEITVENHMSKLMDYLYREFVYRTRTAKLEVQKYSIQKTWWRNYMNTDTDDMHNTIICNICEKSFHVSINSAYYQNHMNKYHKGKRIKDGNMWLKNNFKFVPHIVIMCKLCDTPLSLQLHDKFGPHLKDEHNINQDDEPIVTHDEDINVFLFKFLRNLFEKHKLTEEIEKGKEP